MSKKNKTTSLNVRLTKEDALRIKLQAEIKGKTVSELVRELGS